MASSIRSFSKQWKLGQKETITNFEHWKANMLLCLRQDSDFAPFIKQASTLVWKKKKNDPNKRGLSDTETKKAEERADDLEQMLSTIAIFSPWVKRSTIVNDCKCLNDVWQSIRLHYGFNTSGANFLDFSKIKLEPGEGNEDLYQRMASFIDDNLLKAGGALTHDGETIDDDELVSPTLENLIVLLWLEKLHPRLPALVKQKYATDLRTKTLFSLKPEISMAIPSLLEEVQTFDDARTMRLGGTSGRSNFHKRSGYQRGQGSQYNSNRGYRERSQKPNKECILCKHANRPSEHYLSQCRYLPVGDKKFFAKSRRIMGLLEEDAEEDNGHESDYSDEEDREQDSHHIRRSKAVEIEPDPANIRTVAVKTCPTMEVFFGSRPTTITLDCGAEADLIRLNTVIHLGIKMDKTRHGTTQADGKTPLKVVGEVHCTFTRGDHTFYFDGLVVEDMDCEILGSVPFLERNDIVPRCSNKTIILRDGSIIKYHPITKSCDSTIRKSSLIRAPETQTIWPGEFIELDVPEESSGCSEIALEPRSLKGSHSWVEPAIIKSISGKIRIPNLTDDPQIIRKHDHLAQLVPTFSPKIKSEQASIKSVSFKPTKTCDHTSAISIDPDNCLDPLEKQQFRDLHQKYNTVFDPEYPGYNHAFGKFEAVVNMGKVEPPQRKGKLPQYSRDKLGIVQDHFDKLEALGVLAKPESIGVNVEYLNPSFLVKKSDQSHRLVTAFTEVGRYCKPQPTLLPTVDSTLRSIANWKFLIKTDLKSAYYQIPLSKHSMKYCGTSSPYKGTRVYTRCAMGMPGSETALEELLSRILGDLIRKGVVAKIADDLYVGGETLEELLRNWTAVLECFAAADVRLTGSKTVIAPMETTLLGWIWKNGQLTASPHKISALTKCTKPITTKDMRSFLGAYKVLARVIPRCSNFLQPLSKSTAGKTSSQKIEWTDELTSAFGKAQKHLLSNKAIELPRESDELFIITDGATSPPPGIGATLYVIRDGKPKVAGFFSQQIKQDQSDKWFPCEIEGLAIAASIKFYSAFITQSIHTTRVLTDSKPCCDAYNLLCRGVFSSNARLTTFLNTVSRHHVIISHVSGAAILPSDFSSRNPVKCVSERCQVCIFTTKVDSSVVRHVSYSEIKSGTVQMPFTSRKAWLITQSECPDLRRVKAQLLQGTRPSKKETTIPNVKRYLNKVTIASDHDLLYI